jgi:poly-gamma-glutamate synthesis protein (capsule biosynthesis protein)
VPGADQKKLAKDMIDAGALIVFGDHPHVLQPVERIEAEDGHEGYVIYSLGNFVSGQKGVAKRTSAMIFVGLTKNQNGEVFVNGARHLPLAMMYGADGLTVKPAKGNFEEGRALANRVLSRSLEIEAGEKIVTNPGCRGQ